MWWEQNNLAKGPLYQENAADFIRKTSAASQPSLLTTLFDPQETLILEGTMPLPGSKEAARTVYIFKEQAVPVRLFSCEKTARLITDQCEVMEQVSKKQGSVDRELSLKNSVRFPSCP